MPGSYSNFLATTSYRPYLQPTPGLGSSARTGLAVWLGGPRAGAGSAVRVYNYLSTTGQIYKVYNNPNYIEFQKRYKQWQASRLPISGYQTGSNIISL